MTSEQTIKLNQNILGLYDMTIENKHGEIKRFNNLTFGVAIRVMEEELYKGEADEERD